MARMNVPKADEGLLRDCPHPALSRKRERGTAALSRWRRVEPILEYSHRVDVVRAVVRWIEIRRPREHRNRRRELRRKLGIRRNVRRELVHRARTGRKTERIRHDSGARRRARRAIERFARPLETGEI